MMHAARLADSPRLQRVLEVLSDGREHSTLEISQQARVCAVNSCIAELRGKRQVDHVPAGGHAAVREGVAISAAPRRGMRLMSARAPAAHRCRVRLEDLEAETRRLCRQERRRPLCHQEFAVRLDRVRSGLERFVWENEITDGAQSEVLDLLEEVRSDITAIREDDG